MSTNLQSLQEVGTRPSAIAWFRGLFDRLHVEMTDTGEKFSIIHTGDAIEVIDGFQGDEPNFVIPLASENISNVVSYFSDDAIDPYEEYRIVKFMLRPCLKASLSMPILQNKAFLKVVRVETHWQEALLDNEGKLDEEMTVIHINDQWLIIPGFHGHPQRRIIMTPTQAIEFQRHLLAADNARSITSWIDFGIWYMKWRDSVTVNV
jgi:hypothetical protein